MSEVSGMQRIAHLKSPATESQILERAPCGVRVQPIGKNALLGRTKLPGARQHSATVDPDWHPKSRRVFLCQMFRCQLCRSVKRNGRLRAEALSDACQTHGSWPALLFVEGKGRTLDS